MIISDFSTDHPKLYVPFYKALNNLPGVANDERDSYVRKFRFKRADEFRQDIFSGNGACANAHMPCPLSQKLVQLLTGLFPQGNNLPGVPVQKLPCVGRLYFLAQAIKELCFKIPFQRAYVLADGWLGEKYCLCRFGEAFQFHHPAKYFELPELHKKSSAINF
jgi:hypothetical protein